LGAKVRSDTGNSKGAEWLKSSPERGVGTSQRGAKGEAASGKEEPARLSGGMTKRGESTYWT